MPPAKPLILVVDDNRQNRALVQATLEDEGYELLLAGDGSEGIHLFEKHHPDCVLLDVRMPGMDGFAACSTLRGLPGGADVPILFLTAARDVETFDQAQRAGADDFLTKPVSPAELAVRVRAALKLRRMSAELREQYEVVRRQRDDVIRLQLQKEQLTAFLVHDFKNPVNSMDLQAQVVLRDQPSERARRAALRIRDDARALLRLILDLLDISRSEEGRLQPRPTRVALASLIHDVFSELELRAQEAGVELATELGEPAVRADADLLRRVLGNLVENAIHHAPEGTAVRLTSRRDGETVELRVADAGSGIPPELRDSIFERYVQAVDGGQAPRRTGRGLGLAFCKLAVEAQGGSIGIESGAPGAVFCVRLPVHA